MPLTVMLELTWRCGAACSFCYLGRTGRLNAGRPEMTTGQVRAFMRRFPAGTHFYFTGGEPFLRKDLFDLAAYASARGCTWGVNTSGLAAGAAGIRRLMRLGPAYVIFSLHGPAALHDRLTGVRGAHKKVLANIKAAVGARAAGSEVMTNCVIGPENAALLPAVYLEAARAGADRAVFEHLQFLKPREAAGLDAGAVLTPVLGDCPVDTRAVARSVKKIKALRGAFGTHFELRPDFTRRELERYYGGSPAPAGACRNLFSTVNAEPDGTIRTCVLACGRASGARSYSPAAVLKAKRRLVRGGPPRFCARCCQRLPIERIF